VYIGFATVLKQFNLRRVMIAAGFLDCWLWPNRFKHNVRLEEVHVWCAQRQQLKLGARDKKIQSRAPLQGVES
jgi:hypothetical protein